MPVLTITIGTIKKDAVLMGHYHATFHALNDVLAALEDSLDEINAADLSDDQEKDLSAALILMRQAADKLQGLG